MRRGACLFGTRKGHPGIADRLSEPFAFGQGAPFFAQRRVGDGRFSETFPARESVPHLHAPALVAFSLRKGWGTRPLTTEQDTECHRCTCTASAGAVTSYPERTSVPARRDSPHREIQPELAHSGFCFFSRRGLTCAGWRGYSARYRTRTRLRVRGLYIILIRRGTSHPCNDGRT